MNYQIYYLLITSCRWSQISSIFKENNWMLTEATMIHLRGQGMNNSRTNKKLLRQTNVQELTCRFLFIYLILQLKYYQFVVYYITTTANVISFGRSWPNLFIFEIIVLQTFIDKFRYNAKRASLVQSRIKVILSLLLCTVIGSWTF